MTHPPRGWEIPPNPDAKLWAQKWQERAIAAEAARDRLIRALLDISVMSKTTGYGKNDGYELWEPDQRHEKLLEE